MDAEQELYNLMRGRTSLMIAATSEDSDDESEESDKEEVNQGHESSKEKSDLESLAEGAPENGEDCRTSSSATPQWGSIPAKNPSWGNNPLPDDD